MCQPLFPVIRTSSERLAFQAWLRERGQSFKGDSLRQLIKEFGRPISFAAAYRVAVGYGLFGRRRNSSRYCDFWELIDWRLPNRVLASIWKVDRSSIRSRRILHRLSRPEWSTNSDFRSPTFCRIAKRQIALSAALVGSRPHSKEHLNHV
jgi:hypothetical protein